MEEQLEYFLEYQYKKQELKTYITNKINDAMHKLFGLRYVRTTLIDNILFEGEMYPDGESGLGFDLYRQEIPHFLENELTYTIVNRKNIPGFSFMDCQFYYDAVLRKVYLYYVIDPNNRWGRPDLVKDMYKAINESLHENFYKEQVCELEILGPPEVADPHNECNNGIAELLSKYTIAYWKVFGNRYYFINDSTVVLKDKFREFLTHGTRSFNDFRTKLIAINSSYNAFLTPEDIPAGFEEYNELYNETFHRYLPELPQEEVVEFYLLNYTDFSFIDKYIIKSGGRYNVSIKV